METPNHKFYSVFGHLTAIFAEMEAHIRTLIAGLAFNDDWVKASVFLDRSQFAENLTSLKKLGRQLSRGEEKQIESIVNQANALRETRNLFIHGLWTPRDFGEGEGFAAVTDLRTKFERLEDSYHWHHSSTEVFRVDDFFRIQRQVVEVIIATESLMDQLEASEEYNFNT